jgi:class 3 adenylate cyclase
VSVCAACGQENPDVARFCLQCGAALTTEPHREERRLVSVLFVDIVGFTSRSEQFDPEDVRSFLTPYYERVRAEIERYGGRIEKFVGDAVLGIFGAPIAHGDDAERAVRTALAIRDELQKMNQADDELDLQVSLAVNTGEAIVDLDARPEHGETMVVGDVVNTASRLQAAAPVNGVLVGKETYAATRGMIAYAAAPPVLAKGKAAPIEVWLALSAQVSRIQGDQQFTFKHGLMRAVAYATVPRARRRERHAAVAGFLEEKTTATGESAATLAFHWREAGHVDQAVSYYVDAEHAGRGWAKERAVALYNDAFKLLPDDDERRRDIGRKRALAFQTFYHGPDAASLARRSDD